MELIVNGEEKTIDHPATVRDLVVQMGLGKAIVAVELNKEVVPRKSHENTPLNPGDIVELVTLVGGG